MTISLLFLILVFWLLILALKTKANVAKMNQIVRQNRSNIDEYVDESNKKLALERKKER